jgi:hypothetical protein
MKFLKGKPKNGTVECEADVLIQHGETALIRLSADCFEDALQQGRWRGRAPGDTSINRDYLGNPAQGSIALSEDAARAAAISHGNYDLRRRRGVISPPEGDLHVTGDRPGDEQQVGKPRRGGKMDAEALAVVERIVDRMNLELAPVARAGIDLTDRKASPEASLDDLLQLYADLLDLRIGNGRERLGDDARVRYLFRILIILTQYICTTEAPRPGEVQRKH